MPYRQFRGRQGYRPRFRQQMRLVHKAKENTIHRVNAIEFNFAAGNKSFSLVHSKDDPDYTKITTYDGTTNNIAEAETNSSILRSQLVFDIAAPAITTPAPCKIIAYRTPRGALAGTLTHDDYYAANFSTTTQLLRANTMFVRQYLLSPQRDNIRFRLNLRLKKKRFLPDSTDVYVNIAHTLGVNLYVAGEGRIWSEK